MTGCRIIKVKNKQTGRELHILPTNHAMEDDSVELLIEALQMARRGELKAFGIIAVLGDDHITTSHSQSIKSYSFAGIAACEVLKKRIMETLK